MDDFKNYLKNRETVENLSGLCPKETVEFFKASVLDLPPFQMLSNLRRVV